MADPARAPRPRPKRLPKPVGLLVVLVLVLGLLAGIGVGGQALYRSVAGTPDYSGQGSGQVVVQVMSGDTAADVGRTLFAKDVIKSVKAFTDAAKAEPRSRSLQPGYYSLRLRMSGAAALAMLLDPAARVRGRVTLPEGISVAAAVERLVKSTDLKRAELAEALANPAVLGLPDYARSKPEGFLFPATYDIEPGTGAVDALSMMTERFAQEAERLDLEARAQDMGLSTYDVVKIASIVEAETPLDEDRAKVARVVLNRLAKGMPLQLDSTVNYVREQKRARLSLKDIAVESPFNTYRNRGLPPTPINSPGTKALEAALAPADGDWIYFITIDKQGRSLFTSDYQEFLRAKAKSQREGVY